MNTTEPIIMIVDDDERNTRLLKAQLEAEGYGTMAALSGQECLSQLRERLPDLILLDIMMPGLSGFEVAGRLKADSRTKNIPIIMITALEDRDSKIKALYLGAEEFLNKPVDRAELQIRVRNLLRLKEYQNFLAEYNRRLEAQVAERTADLWKSYRETIYIMTSAAEYKDEDTGAHVQRVSHYTRDLARTMGQDAAFCDHIFYASPMHDVGKIAIPDHVLLKPGALLPDEWAIMKSHSDFGARILESGDSPYLEMARAIALGHHERWDGSGYPGGLKGESIPLPARIMAVCDVYDALRSRRPYKPAFSHERALAIITEGDDRTQPGHFDPAVHGAFADRAGEMSRIYAEIQD